MPRLPGGPGHADHARLPPLLARLTLSGPKRAGSLRLLSAHFLCRGDAKDTKTCGNDNGRGPG